MFADAGIPAVLSGEGADAVHEHAMTILEEIGTDPERVRSFTEPLATKMNTLGTGRPSKFTTNPSTSLPRHRRRNLAAAPGGTSLTAADHSRGGTMVRMIR